MKGSNTALLRCGMVAASMLNLCGGAAPASDAELDRMVAAGKSQRELAQYLFENRGCNGCHTVGREGKLGFTKKGQETGQGFEGCVSTLKAMTVIAKVPENQRSDTQRRRAQRFEEFGCATCHDIIPGKIGLTKIGAKLANLHLGCVEVQKLLATGTGSRR